jgi:hypothetical protein
MYLPKLFATAFFLFTAVSKLIDPGAFFLLVNSFVNVKFLPDFILTGIIISELLLVYLLIFKTKIGLLLSFVYLIISLLTKLAIYNSGAISISGCFQYVILNESLVAICFQYIGFAMLILGSYFHFGIVEDTEKKSPTNKADLG